MAQPLGQSASMRLKRALVVLTLASSLLFTGIIFGWAPLVLTLRDEGIYASDACRTSSSHACAMEQGSRLNYMYAMGSTFTVAFALPVGLFLDRFGAAYTIGCAGVLEVVGLVGMALSQDPRDGPDWFTVSYILMAMGGSMLMMGNFHIGFVFPDSMETLLAGISCLFDASSVIFAVYQTLYFRLNLTRKLFFLLYAGLAAFSYSLISILWWALLRRSNLSKTTDAEKQETSGSDQGVSLSQRMRSTPFAFIFAFGTVHFFKTYLYLGVNDELLEAYGDSNYGHIFTKAFGYIIPLGFFCIPLIGTISRRSGLLATLKVTNALAIAYSVLMMIPTLAAQPFAMIIYTCYRAFLFSVVAAFNARVFGYQSMGTIQGAVSFSAGVLNLCQNPLLSLTVSKLSGDFFPLNVFNLLLCLPFVFAIRPGILSKPWETKKADTADEETALLSGSRQ